MKAFKKGTGVEWKWGRGHAAGQVEEIHHDRVTKTIKGKKITRNATREMPAYLIRQKNGSKVLKLHSELYPAERKHGWA